MKNSNLCMNKWKILKKGKSTWFLALKIWALAVLKFFDAVLKFELPNARVLNFPKISALSLIRLVLINGDCVYSLFYFLQNQNKQRIFIFWTKYWIGCHVWNETKRWLLSNIEKRTYWTHFLVRPFQKGFFNPKVKIISNLWLGQFFEMVWKNSPQTCVCTACLLWCNAACLDVQSFYSRLHIQDCINSRYYGVAQFQEGIANVLR